MSLTLTVTSRHSQMLGPAAVKVFSDGGGSIGRGPGNDWVLPDPSKFVSTRHANIEFDNGDFYLCDTSTNGTFVNGSAEPVVFGSRVLLNHGDSILIGEYELAVTLSVDQPSYPPQQRPVPSSRPSGFGPEAPEPPRAASPFFDEPPPRPTYDDRQWQLPPEPFPQRASEQSWDPDASGDVQAQDPLDIMRDSGGLSRPFAPLAPKGPAVWQDSAPLDDHFAVPPAARPEPGASAGQIPSDWDKTTFPRQPDFGQPNQPAPQPTFQQPGPQRGWDDDVSQEYPSARNTGGPPPFARAAPPPPPRAAERAPPPPAQAGYRAAPDAGALRHILEVAGMDPAAAQAAVNNPELAENLGEILQLFVQGMMDVLRVRSEVKGTFRLELTRIGSVENNPLKFCPDSHAALSELFAKRGSGYLTPIEAVREAFDDTKAHQMAMMAGMQAAFESLMKRFNPEELQREFDTIAGGRVFKSLNKAKYWDGLVDLYHKQMRNSDESFKRLFGEPFAEAYEAQMVRLTGARRRH